MKHYYRHFCKMHKGKIIEKVVRTSGIPISKLAKKLKRSRHWLYRIFESEQVSIDSIIEIGRAIHYDFSSDFDIVPTYGYSNSNQLLEEESAEYWKLKYIHLLEEYNSLLKNK